ncbi:MAG: NADH dehydrogenase [Elusimicrobia bacterium RIFOXYA2_FULL_58_8]|nr:MAG: NADH dehydrogenase [Elusimicrobia bacterium RIFOXYA12_FULL_57_11]OGS13897.1 MAG: NADH dehydrogenase [Elusimicrobia bacterium RIFOXYA2_FULL_58_8]
MKPESKAARVLENYAFAKRDKLIPILQDIQAADGFLSKQAVLEVARHLKIPSSKVYGVATFYNQFRFKPLGRHHIMICRGTACHVKGSAAVLKMTEEALGIKAGDTTRDGLFSIEVVACIGACGLAPVISINGEFHAKITPDKIKKLVDEIKTTEKSNGAK